MLLITQLLRQLKPVLATAGTQSHPPSDSLTHRHESKGLEQKPLNSKYLGGQGERSAREKQAGRLTESITTQSGFHRKPKALRTSLTQTYYQKSMIQLLQSHQ